MKNSTFFCSLLMFTLLLACNSKAKKDQAQSITSNSESKNDDEIKSKDFIIVGDSIQIPSFEVELKLSKKAEEKLTSDDEPLQVVAVVNGEGKFDPDQIGTIILATSTIELTDKRNIVFKNIKFAKKDYNALKNKNIWITVEVSSGTKGSTGNFLDVELLDEDVEKVMNEKFVLNGKLIYE